MGLGTPVDDQAEDAACRDRIEKEHRPDRRDMTPRGREGGDDAENGHAEIEAHDRPEHLGLVGALNRDGHGLGEDGSGIDAVAQRRRHEDRRNEQEKEPHHAAFPPGMPTLAGV